MKKTAKERIAAKKVNKQLILRALTDPKFRKKLERNPAAALGKKDLTAIHKKEVDMVIAAVRGIESQMSIIADELLCACSVTV